ncbi:MAG: hypothetical protein LBJ44_10395 [Propionibacteriaceae bacterium]|nr:hypothetical protein [Propionibacteriaceae bacterium]
MLVPPAPPADLDLAARPTTVPVARQEFTDDLVVEVVFQMGEAVPLVLRTSGVVTGPLQSPAVLVSGRPALVVDLRPVVALHTGVPLFRDLAVGDRGGDVAALNQELARLGRPNSSLDRFTAQTAQGWAELSRDCGIAPARGGALKLADVLWLPAVSVALESWSAVAGTSVGAGETVGGVRSGLSGVDLNFVNGRPLLEGPRTLTVFGLTTQIEDLSAGLPADFLRDLENSPDLTQIRSGSTTPVTKGYLSLATPISVLRAPPAAIFAVSGNRACLQVDGRGRPVTLVGADLGGTLIVPDDEEPIAEVAFGAGVTLTGC